MFIIPIGTVPIIVGSIVGVVILIVGLVVIGVGVVYMIKKKASMLSNHKIANSLIYLLE